MALESLQLSSFQTALAILLPPSSPHHKDISTLRSLYDKNAEIWPPHINLLYPFVAPESLPTAVDTIKKYFTTRCNGSGCEVGVTPLTVRLDKAGIWKHKDHATIYLSQSGQEDTNQQGKLELRGLREELLSLFSTPAGVEAGAYTPHLTIGQTAVNEEVMVGLLGKAQKLVGNAGSGGIQWNATRLVVLQRGASKSGMRTVGEISLGTQAVGEGHGHEYPDSEHDSPQEPGFYHVYVFSGNSGAYVPYTPGESKPPDMQTLTLATYNIFTESAMPTTVTRSRYPLLLSAILSTTASVINLQEVSDDFLAYLLAQSEIQQRFPYSTHSPSHGILPSWRNCVTLASYPLGDARGMWEFVELGRHKGAVVVELNFGPLATDLPKGPEAEEHHGDIYKLHSNKRLVLANVHLTCGISDGAAAAKVTQLRVLSSYFLNRKTSEGYSEAWAICGDFNIPTSHLTIQTAYTSQEISQETYNLLLNTDGEGKGVIPEMWKDTYHLTHSLNGIADVEDLKFDIGNASGGIDGDLSPPWKPGALYAGAPPLTLGAGEFGATFNPLTNRLCVASVKSGANPRPQRYDRILVSGNAVGCARNWIKVKNTGRFGLEGGSDHWGLYATISTRDSNTELKGTNSSRKTWLKLESRLEGKADMTNKALEKYLDDCGMLPSQKDYTIREEAKGVLTMILTDGSEKHHESQTVPPTNYNLTPMQHVYTPAHGATQYQHPDGGPTSPPVSQTQRLGFKEKPQGKIIVQSVGSYYMNLFTPTSDLDILCASNISARVFWILVKQRIRRHNRTISKTRGKAGVIRIIRTVEAQSGTMMELEYIGGVASDDTSQVQKPEDIHITGTNRAVYGQYSVRIDLQYCQVPDRVLNSWNRLPYISPSDPIFSLSAITCKKLNAYRDSSFLLQTIPDLKAFRLAYRLLKLWATRHGIFSARFGYLGGIHLVLLLSHVFKSIPADQETDLTACEFVKLFFEHYAGFKYEGAIIGDPDSVSLSGYRRTLSREPLVITTIHSPMVNVADTASQHTLKTLRDQISLANQKLDKGCTWDEVTGGSDGEAEREFLNAFANFVKIEVRYWGRNTARGRSLVGWIESRCVYLLVELNSKVPNMHARVWPGRFVNINEPHDGEEFNAFYLIGLRNIPSQRPEGAQETIEQKKAVYSKFMEILRSFEAHLREREKEHEVAEYYVAVTRASRQLLGEDVRTDKQVWWDEDNVGGEDDEDSLDEEDAASDIEEGGERETSREADERTPVMSNDNSNDNSTQGPPKRTGRSQHKHGRRDNQATDEMDTLEPRQEYVKKTRLRPAHDIINRIKWDSDMDVHDYIIGYEDRFLGILQMNLEKWIGHRKDETDEEWMPMHRVVWITRASDGVVVWHRGERIDRIFGSGDAVE